MARKIFFLLLFTILQSLFVLPGYAYAQAEDVGNEVNPIYTDKMIAPYPGTSTPFLGQTHYYSYVFRGNGEAVVTARIALANTSESEALKETFLRFPGYEPKDIAVYQIIASGQCIRYSNPDYDAGNGKYQQPVCAEYGEPDYYGYYGAAKYQKAEFEFKGDTLNIKFPKAISPQKSGAYFIYFRTFAIAQKANFGSYSYQIETLKVDDQINQLFVGINTDSDLFLKGAKGEVNYRVADSDVAALKAVPEAGSASSSPAIDRVLSNVGYGQISKTASSLAPFESYKVSGEYAKTRLGLYRNELTVGIAVLILFIAITALAAVRILHSLRSKDEARAAKPGYGFLSAMGISFLGSVMIGIYTFAVIFAASFISKMYYQYQSFVGLFLVIISFCIYSFLLFIPGIFYGYKKGIGWGIGVIMMTIVWLIVFFAVGLGFALLFTSGNNPVALMSY